MPILDFLEKWGHLLYQNPVAFLVFAGIVAGLTWWVASFRIAVLNDRISALKEQNSFLEKSSRAGSQQAPAKPSLTTEQYGEIVRKLSQARMIDKDLERERHVVIEIGIGFMENVDVAEQLRDAIKDAGWQSSFSLGRPDPKYKHGIWILGSGEQRGGLPATRSILKTALGSAGLQAQEAEDMQVMGDSHPFIASVIIGKLESR
jgi:hypothetical protein